MNKKSQKRNEKNMINIRRWIVEHLLLGADEEIIQTTRRIELEQYEKIYKKIKQQKKDTRDPKPKTTKLMRNINYQKSNNSYAIRKGKNGVQIHFGSSQNKDHAIAIRDYLEYRNWDENLTAKSFGLGKRYADAYYFVLKPIIVADKDYQEYLKEMGE